MLSLVETEKSENSENYISSIDTIRNTILWSIRSVLEGRGLVKIKNADVRNLVSSLGGGFYSVKNKNGKQTIQIARSFERFTDVQAIDHLSDLIEICIKTAIRGVMYDCDDETDRVGCDMHYLHRVERREFIKASISEVSTVLKEEKHGLFNGRPTSWGIQRLCNSMINHPIFVMDAEEGNGDMYSGHGKQTAHFGLNKDEKSLSGHITIDVDALLSAVIGMKNPTGFSLSVE